MKEELLKDLEEIQSVLKDYKTFKSIISDNIEERTLGNLYRATQRIGLLLAMNELKDVCHPENSAVQKPLFGGNVGDMVSIRPVAEEYKGKSFIGFMIGEIATGSSISVTENKIQLNFSGHNPAIFVPFLGKIIYGYESWWAKIEDENDFKEITEKDIENVWYVKLWKQMQESKSSTNV